MGKFFLFISVPKHNKMENSELRKDLVFTVINGILYLEHTEALEFLGVPRTTFNRMLNNLSLLEEGDMTYFKNRKLLRADFIFGFWKLVSTRKWGR